MIIGIVGKPNVGKSTFFKAATLAEVEIANYPFTTIKKNEGVAYVKVPCPEKEFKVRCNPNYGFCIDANRFVPIQLIDIAGLVPEAHLGKGLGNQFLDDIRQADVLIHVIDISGSVNEQGQQQEPLSYDPAKDILFLEYEIDMWLFNILKKHHEKIAKLVETTKQDICKVLAEQLSSFKVNEDILKEIFRKLNIDKEKPSSWQEQEIKQLATEIRKRTKPMIIACNKIDIPQAEKNLERLKQEFPDKIFIPCCAEAELALREAAKNNLIKYIPGESDFEIINKEKLTEKQLNALKWIKENILAKYKSTGVQETLNKAVFSLLKYIYVFPVANSKLQDNKGNILPDCILLPSNATALQLAEKIHSEIAEKFVKAINIRNGKVLGKESKLNNADIIEIITS